MVTRIQTPAPLRAVSERGHSEVRARLSRPVGAERSDWTRLGFKHRADSWGTRQRAGREPGQEQISATAEAVQGAGERTGGGEGSWPGLALPARARGQGASSPALPGPLVWFPWQRSGLFLPDP